MTGLISLWNNYGMGRGALAMLRGEVLVCWVFVVLFWICLCCNLQEVWLCVCVYCGKGVCRGKGVVVVAWC